MRRFSLARSVAALLVIGTAGHIQPAQAWHDPSPHKVQFVRVEQGIQLELLDWGGAGIPLVLLAGAGSTAHVFDDFAPKLTSTGHVYGITRRGFGASTHDPNMAAYGEQRLADDVLAVVDALHLEAPVIIGHSMAGEEMTRLGEQHSDRLGALVFLDAAGDQRDWPADDPTYMALYNKLPERMRKPPPPPTKADLKSFSALRNYRKREMHIDFPEADLRATYKQKPDGSVGDNTMQPGVWEALNKGAERRDYSHIRVPILALFPSAAKTRDDPPRTPEEWAAVNAFDAATAKFTDRWKANLQKAQGGVQIVNIPGANHYLFISNPDDVLRELRPFLAHLAAR